MNILMIAVLFSLPPLDNPFGPQIPDYLQPPGQLDAVGSGGLGPATVKKTGDNGGSLGTLVSSATNATSTPPSSLGNPPPASGGMGGEVAAKAPPTLPAGFNQWGLRDNLGIEHRDSDYFKLRDVIVPRENARIAANQAAQQTYQAACNAQFAAQYPNLHYHSDGRLYYTPSANYQVSAYQSAVPQSYGYGVQPTYSYGNAWMSAMGGYGASCATGQCGR